MTGSDVINNVINDVTIDKKIKLKKIIARTLFLTCFRGTPFAFTKDVLLSGVSNVVQTINNNDMFHDI